MTAPALSVRNMSKAFRAVQALEDQRRVRIEALGRSVAGTGTLVAVAASAVVVIALLASIQIGG